MESDCEKKFTSRHLDGLFCPMKCVKTLIIQDGEPLMFEEKPGAGMLHPVSGHEPTLV